MRSLKNELNAMQIIPKAVVNDNDLSFDARFLYVYMACKEEGWKPNVKTLAKEINYQPKDLLDLLSELIKEGWVSEVKHDDADFEYVLNMECKERLVDVINEYASKKVAIVMAKPSDDKGKELFEQCWVAYHRKGSKKKAFDQWCKLKEDERSRVMAHVKAYTSTRELNYQKDFERYLRDKTFNDVVMKGNSVIYDPAKQQDGDFYSPALEGFIQWSDEYRCHIYLGMYFDGMDIADGYTDDTRPDGAIMMLNNARGKLKWSKSNKKWEREW